MMHDSLTLTAPHTLRELAQADTEAGAMHAKQIAAMIAEDAYLDGQFAENAKNSGAAKARALLEVWLETPKEGDPMVDCLLGTIADAHTALGDIGKPRTGDLIDREAAIAALLDHGFDSDDVALDILLALPAAQIGGAA